VKVADKMNSERDEQMANANAEFSKAKEATDCLDVASI